MSRSVAMRLVGTRCAAKDCGRCRKSPWKPANPSAAQCSNCSIVRTLAAIRRRPRPISSGASRASASVDERRIARQLLAHLDDDALREQRGGRACDHEGAGVLDVNRECAREPIQPDLEGRIGDHAERGLARGRRARRCRALRRLIKQRVGDDGGRRTVDRLPDDERRGLRIRMVGALGHAFCSGFAHACFPIYSCEG